jgi:hypothetical protein
MQHPTSNRISLILLAAGLAMAAMYICFSPPMAVAQGNRVGPESAYPPASVPGFPNPDVTQENISSTVCRAGWTKTIRPPGAYTNKLKAQQMVALHLPGKPSEYEEDHFLSLEISGHPTDPRNLWPQSYSGQYGARVKDQVEDKMKRELCAGRMTLKQVQDCIISDWIACGRAHGAIK